MLNIKRILTACFLLVCFTTVAQSQAKKVVADKIAAVVGDKLFLNLIRPIQFWILPVREELFRER
jgi:hypothetical protein